MKFINRVSLRHIRDTRNNRLGDITARQFVDRYCSPVLQNAMSSFCFDKFPYVLCKDQKLPSVHAAMHHGGGNCYSFAWKVRNMLQESGLEAFIISGMPPPYFMRPGFRAICHAGVFVPFSRDKRAWGVLIDPSVYVPPMIVSAKGDIPTPSGKSVMKSYCDTLCTTGSVSTGTMLVNPRAPTNRALMVRVPPGCLLASVRPGCGDTFFSFVLAEVQDFDKEVTEHVHAINRDVFRTSTDKHGRWKTSIRYKPDLDIVHLTDHTGDHQVSIRGDDIATRKMEQSILSMGPEFIRSLRYPDPSKARAVHLAAMLQKVRRMMRQKK